MEPSLLLLPVVSCRPLPVDGTAVRTVLCVATTTPNELDPSVNTQSARAPRLEDRPPTNEAVASRPSRAPADRTGIESSTLVSLSQ